MNRLWVLKKNNAFVFSTILLLLGLPAIAWGSAQDAAPDTTPATIEEVEVPATKTAEKESSETESNEADTVSREEFDTLKAELTELRNRMDTAEEEAEFEALEAAGIGEFEPSLNIYGFTTVDFYKVFVTEDSPLAGLMHDRSSFGIQDLNIYFAGQMTDTMRVLTELEFTFMPHGSETDLLTYTRIDNTYGDLYTNEKKTLGGVHIVRAQYDWKPVDYFNVTVGRFLTPFGIWNNDHGSTVVIPHRLPFLMIRGTIPLAQTGLMISGRFFPADSTYIDYGFTVTNGRGPTSEIYDLNEHKALGARLRFEKEWENASLALGAYGFWSKMTDIVKTLDIEALEFEKEVVEEFWEYDIATDLLFKFWGGRIQAEYVRGLIQFEKRPPVLIPEVNIIDPSGGLRPDYVKWDMYVLGAWDFNLDTKHGDVVLTPFIEYEHSVMDDTNPDLEVGVITYGINLSPNPFVVVKLAGAHIYFPSSISVDDPVNTINTQLCVAF